MVKKAGLWPICVTILPSKDGKVGASIYRAVGAMHSQQVVAIRKVVAPHVKPGDD